MNITESSSNYDNLEQMSVGELLEGIHNEDNKILGGVCSGLAAHLGIDPTLIRIGFVVLSMFLHIFPGVLLYVILLL